MHFPNHQEKDASLALAETALTELQVAWEFLKV
jgi:hypothetical protein